MIFILVLVYLDGFKRLGDKYPFVRRIIGGDPPSGLGQVFVRD